MITIELLNREKSKIQTANKKGLLYIWGFLFVLLALLTTSCNQQSEVKKETIQTITKQIDSINKTEKIQIAKINVLIRANNEELKNAVNKGGAIGTYKQMLIDNCYYRNKRLIDLQMEIVEKNQTALQTIQSKF